MKHWAFDLDGTILDCRQRQVALMRKLVAAESGLQFNEHAYWRTKREGHANGKALIEAGIPESRIKPLCDAWIEAIEDDEWLTLDERLPGAADALRSAHDSGIELVIITARQRATGVHQALLRLELDKMITQVCVVSPISGVDKQKAAHLRDFKAELFFGDSETDYAAAQLAGIEFAAVACGQRNAEFLRALGATTYSSLQDAVAENLRGNC